MRYEFVQTAYDGGLFDVRRTADEIKHEIEYDLGIGSGEHWCERFEWNTPALWVNKKERECVGRYVVQNHG